MVSHHDTQIERQTDMQTYITVVTLTLALITATHCPVLIDAVTATTDGTLFNDLMMLATHH